MRSNRFAAVLALGVALATLAAGAQSGTPPTPWGDPDLQGEWTSEGEFGTRAFLTDAEYAERIAQARACDERDLHNYVMTNMLATSRALERKAQ